MRVHSTKSATPHFPFLWPEPYRSHMREALNRRYQLLPYHYSLAHRMYSEGKLWMRPLAAQYPSDKTAAPISSQWLDGDKLLVAPVLSEDASSNVYLPAGKWFHFNSSATENGPTTLNRTVPLGEVPVFALQGAVVPLAPLVQYTDALPGGPLEVHVYGGADGAFTLSEDDGETISYQTTAHVRRTHLKWDDTKATLSWTVDAAASSSAQMFTQLRVKLFVAGEQAARHSAIAALDGKSAGSVVVPLA